MRARTACRSPLWTKGATATERYWPKVFNIRQRSTAAAPYRCHSAILCAARKVAAQAVGEWPIPPLPLQSRCVHSIWPVGPFRLRRETVGKGKRQHEGGPRRDHA
jgi:hypothetical protein